MTAMLTFRLAAALAGLCLCIPVAAQPTEPSAVSNPKATTGYPLLDDELSEGDYPAFATLVEPLDAQARAHLGQLFEQMPLYYRGALARAILDMPNHEGVQAVRMLAQQSPASIPAAAAKLGSPTGRDRWPLLGELAVKAGPTAGIAILLDTNVETACTADTGASPEAVSACIDAGKKYLAPSRLPLVPGGYEAPLGSAPWQVQIFAAGADAKRMLSPNAFAKDIRYFGYRRPDWQHLHICGGVWLGEGWVLTAAHCVEAWRGEANFFDSNRVRTGSRDISGIAGHVWRIESLVRHGEFDVNDTKLGHDIALLRLAPNPTGRPQTKLEPITLPTRPFPPGTALRLTGWGVAGDASGIASLRAADGYVPSFTQLLHTGPLVLRRPDACTNHQNYVDRYPGWKMMPGQVCAGTPANSKKDIDACQGDSGGPLVARRGGRFQLVGLVSFGPSCGLPDTPGVYTNVAYYAAWIKGAMQQARPGMIIDWTPGNCRRGGRPIACLDAPIGQSRTLSGRR